ncbi:MAG TPA: IS21-like element helper ATPase IstB [Polyangia bacterium]
MTADTTVAAELIRAQARRLRLPGLSKSFEPLARRARQGRWPSEEYLREALAAEELSRNDSVVRNRIRAARFPEAKTLDRCEFNAADGVDAAVVAQLARCEWIREGRNLILAGPVGTGKSHLAIGIGMEAARQRLHVAFVRAADLVRSLIEARDARELGRMQRRLQRVDLIVLDELGFVPFDRAGGALLFNVLSQRHSRRSVVITTNLSFSEWPRVFGGDEKLTTAPLDRLAEAATITTRGKSYRMRHRKAGPSGREASIVPAGKEKGDPTGTDPA